jgi:hypothetical protein
MEKLMWEYLDTAYPNSYRRETKFGLLTVLDNSDTTVLQALKRLSKMFSCSELESTIFIKKWIESLPIVKPIDNSTNPDVLVYS